MTIRRFFIVDYSHCVVIVDDDPRRSAELYQVHKPMHPKEIQSQQRIRNMILFGKPQARKNMIRCGLFSGACLYELVREVAIP
ncbi:hypothetical protein AVEN_270905-1, partial [Araneus ventricosus]